LDRVVGIPLNIVTSADFASILILRLTFLRSNAYGSFAFPALEGGALKLGVRLLLAFSIVPGLVSSRVVVNVGDTFGDFTGCKQSASGAS